MRRLQAIRQLAAMAAALALTGIAHAQYGGPPGGGGYGGGGQGSNGQWVRTISASGTISGTSGLPPSSGSSPWGATQEVAYSTGGVDGAIGSYKTGDMSASVTYTYTWNGGPNNVPAPKYVVVVASGSAHWHAPKVNSSGACSVTVSGDLVESTPVTENSPTSAGQSISKIGFKVVNSASGTVTTTVGVSSSVSATVNADLLSRGAVTQSAGAGCQLWSVQLDVSGTTKTTAGDHKILIGQGCRPGLSLVSNVSPANPAGTMPVEIDPTGYNWSVTGDKFDRFEIGASTGKMLTCEAADALLAPPVSRWMTPSPVWRWWKESAATINCTAKIRRVGTNALINSVTYDKAVTVEAPAENCLTNTGVPSWAPTPATANALTSATVINGFITHVGAEFNGAVSTPNFYRGPGSGTWVFGQLVQTTRTVNGAVITPAVWGTEFVLDNAWPYAGMFPVAADSTSTVPHYFATNDSPTQGITGANSVAVSDLFNMYMAYTPPDTGQGNAMVMVRKVDWSFIAAGSRTLDFVSGLYIWGPTPPGSVTVNSNAMTRVHPLWNYKASNSPGGGGGYGGGGGLGQ